MARRTDASKPTALGGVLAALAVVIMSMGGLIPVATYVCPAICMILLNVVRKLCGNRYAWAWYGAVSILGLLLGPDKEAAAVFLFLGYYPIVKPALDRLKLKWLWKGLLFNISILVMYWLLMHLFGMDQLTKEFEEMGTLLLIVTLILGNMVFLMVDRMLSRELRIRR